MKAQDLLTSCSCMNAILHKDGETRMTAHACLCSGVQDHIWWQGAFTEVLHRHCSLHFIKCLARLPWWPSQESACNAGDLDSVSGSGRSPGEVNGYPLQYSCLENSMDRGSRWAWGYKEADMTEQLNSNYYYHKCPPIAPHSFSPSPFSYLQARQTWLSFDLADPFHPCGYRCAQK